VKRASGPEEFFVALGEIHEGKKQQTTEGGPQPQEPLPPAGEEAPPPGTIELSHPAAGGAIVIALLLIVLAYLVGRQHGWSAYEAALRSQSQAPPTKATTHSPAAKAPDQATPELVDGAVFTLLTLGKTASDLESVQKEADYLNKYAPFQSLGLQAYAWRDRAGRYRLCARGFKGMDEATRKQVREGVRSLVSRQNRREYRDSDFLAP